MSDEVVENDTVTADEAVTEVVDERSDVERERDEYLDALQRLQADFENYRKRVARSSMDAADRAAGEVVVKMLPVLDAFDLAAAHFRAHPPKRPRRWIRPGGFCSTPCRERDWNASTPWALSSIPKCTTRSRTSRARTVPWSTRCCAPGTGGRVPYCVQRW
jgi:hypothetical protein